MMIKLLWISSLWLGIGFFGVLSIWFAMAVSRRFQKRQAPAVREVATERPVQAKAPFHVLVRGGGAMPMRVAKNQFDKGAGEEHLISAPGGHG